MYSLLPRLLHYCCNFGVLSCVLRADRWKQGETIGEQEVPASRKPSGNQIHGRGQGHFSVLGGAMLPPALAAKGGTPDRCPHPSRAKQSAPGTSAGKSPVPSWAGRASSGWAKPVNRREVAQIVHRLKELDFPQPIPGHHKRWSHSFDYTSLSLRSKHMYKCVLQMVFCMENILS